MRPIRTLRSWFRREEGATLPFIAILLPVLVAFAGLAFDGGTIFVAKREALNVATAAARRGAADVTEASLYNGRPELAPTAAATAADFATAQGYNAGAATYGGNDDKVFVSVQVSVDLVFGSFIGINQVIVNESAIAQVQSFTRDGD